MNPQFINLTRFDATSEEIRYVFGPETIMNFSQLIIFPNFTDGVSSPWSVFKEGRYFSGIRYNGTLNVLAGQKGSLLVSVSNNTYFKDIVHEINITIDSAGSLAFFLRDSSGYSVIHCCVINNTFSENSLGPYNSINIVKAKSNVTFWQDLYKGVYYASDTQATLGLNEAEESLITVHDCQFAIEGTFKKSSSIISN